MSSAEILAIWVTLSALFSILINASNLPANALAPRASENRIKIELIDVKCDKNEDSMQVTIEFSQPFEGIIYSQGYFNDPKCRYVSAGEGEKSYNFVVPYEGCGSKPSCAICDSIDNILIIQQDEEVQGEFDAARKISCSRTGIEEEKKIYFKPFIVDMLDVVSVPTKSGGVDCWMDIQRGVYPKLSPVGEVIKIGESLSVLVYLRDQKNEYDLSVRNCWAYDGEDFDDKKTGKVQLSDASGCTMKRKLFGTWQKTSETGSSGATLLLHNTLRAFKFPDESQVYLKCDIEICRGNCAEAICDAEEVSKVDCTLNPRHESCIRNKIVERTNPLVGFTTVQSTSYEPPTTTRMHFIDTTRRPNFAYTTTQRPNYISTTILEEETTTLKPLICTPDSRDIRCIQQQYDEITENAGVNRETTTYANQFKTTTIKAGLESFCKQYPKHKRCNQRVTDDLQSNIEILTFKPPSPFVTVKSKPSIISRNEIESENLQLFPTTEASEIYQQQFDCKGPNLDPRCPNPTGTTAPTYLPPSTTKRITPSTTNAPRCYPGSLDPRCPRISTPSVIRTTTKPPLITQKTTKKLFICVPGSNDVNCDIESTKVTEEPTVKETTTYLPPRNQYTTTKQPEKSICFLGSTNPECQKVSTEILTFKPRPSTTSIPPTTTKRPFISTTRAPICYPGSTDPRCPKSSEKVTTEIPETTTYKVPSTTRAPICYLGSPDPRCAQLTTEKVFTTFGTTSDLSTRPPIPTTPDEPICYPGSLDSRCPKPQQTTKTIIPETTVTQKVTEIPETTTYKLPSTTRTPICYLGSPDPRCAQTTKKVFVPSVITSTSPPFSTAYVTSTSRAPICYPGSLDPRCVKPRIIIPQIDQKVGEVPETTTYKIQSTTQGPICYPGALDPRCKNPTTNRVIVPSTKVAISQQPSISPPRCYPGSLDPRCIQSTTKQPPFVNLISTTVKPPFSTTRTPVRCYPGSLDPNCASKPFVVPLQCGPGYLDPRCPNPTPTAEPATYLPPQISTTFKTPRPSITTTPAPPFSCAPNSLDPRCKIVTTTRFIPSTTTEVTTATFAPETTTRPVPSTTKQPVYTTRLPYSFPTFTTRTPITVSTAVPQCTPNSLDPRCRTFTTTKYVPSIRTEGTTTTFAPDTTTKTAPLTTKQPVYTTRPPFSFPTTTARTPIPVSTPVQCTPDSLDPRCKTYTTPKFIPSVTNGEVTATILPDTTTRLIPTTTRPPFPTFSTNRIISSPRPFTTRPTTKGTTTTENILCYPGSTIEGCKQTYTTPSYCYPGSKDPRCPQLPPSFSTRKPEGYLPPLVDSRFSRVKRQTFDESEKSEIVKISLTFRPFNFS